MGSNDSYFISSLGEKDRRSETRDAGPYHNNVALGAHVRFLWEVFTRSKSWPRVYPRLVIYMPCAWPKFGGDSVQHTSLGGEQYTYLYNSSYVWK